MTERETQSTASPPRRRGWFTFSLRTFLIGSTLASLAIWGIVSWLRPPRPAEETLPGGLEWHEARKANPAAASAAGGKPPAPLAQGAFSLVDRHGRTLATGRNAEGRATGRWKHYHATGGVALSGECDSGAPVGQWTAWNDRGRKQVEVAYETRDATRGLGNESDFKSSVRSGPFRQWWPNGRLKATGTMRDDLRDGGWTHYGESGRKTAEGNYRFGLRSGPWQIFDLPGGKSRATWFVAGHEVPNRQERVQTLAARLKTCDDDERYEIVETLGLLGEPAVPVLAELLATHSSHLAPRDEAPALAEREGYLDRSLALWTLRTIASLGPDAQAALPAIGNLLTSTDQQLRREALVTIFVIDDANRPSTFRKLLLESDLAEFEDARAWHRRLSDLQRLIVPSLAAALDDPDRGVRLRALDVTLQTLYPSRTGAWHLHHEYLGEEGFKLLDKAARDSDLEISRAAKDVLEVRRRHKESSL